MAKKRSGGKLRKKRSTIQRDPYRTEHVAMPFLELFADTNDVFEEHDAFAPDKIHKSLGRLYRSWLNAREALDPNFDRQKYRHEMKSRKTAKKTTPLGRSLPVEDQPRSSTGSISTSGKNRKPNASNAKQGAKRSVKGARSGSSAFGGPSRTTRSQACGAEWLIVNENVSGSGSRARASEKSQSSRH